MHVQRRLPMRVDGKSSWNHNGTNLVASGALEGRGITRHRARHVLKEVLVNLTLKNIPDEVYARLKAAAETHRRSLNSEAIVCLESALLLGRLSVSERLQRARQFRARLSKEGFRASDIDSFRMEGRR